MFIKLESSKAVFIKVGSDPFVGLEINLLGPSLLKRSFSLQKQDLKW